MYLYMYVNTPDLIDTTLDRCEIPKGFNSQ